MTINNVIAIAMLAFIVLLAISTFLSFKALLKEIKNKKVKSQEGGKSSEKI